MSPEQAKGRAADKRSDVWAFGAVLYEMLTGRRPFEGEDLSDTLATVLKSEPDWNALPADVPPHIRMLIQRCLAKDRRQRMADMSVALFVMAEAASLAPAAVVTGGPTATAGATTAVAPPRDADCRGHRGWCRGWHGRLARDASERGSRHAFRPLSNGCGGVVRGPSELATSRSRRTARTSSTKGPEPPARSSSCAHWISSSRRRSRASARRAARSLAGWAMDRLRRHWCPRHAQEGGHHRRTGPPPLPPRWCKPGRHLG